MAKKTSIGAIIKLDGESTFRASIQNCKTSVAAMKAELEGIKSQYKDNANGLEALSAVYDKYAEIQDEAAKSVKKTSDIFEASKKKQRETKEIMNEMLSVYEKAEKELSEMKKSGTASADAIEAQEKAVEQAKAEYEKYATAVEKCGARTNFFKKALAEASREQQDAAIAMQEYAVYIREAEESADGCATSIDKYGKKIEESGDAAEKAGGAMEVFKGSLAADFAAKGLEKVCDLLKTAAEYSVDVGSNFESSMSKVEAISGASAMQMQDLTKKAETVGKESKRFSASDAADALQYMALAGWETRDMLNSIDGVINLAEASEMDLAKASDIVTDYITAFGLSSKDAAHFVDIMAYAMSNSNTNTEQLGEAYKNVAATAGSFGYSVEDTTAALMVMANAGVKGGEAGTALNAIMTRLATNSSGCADELKKYGISVYDSAGKIKPLSSIILGISSAFSSLTDAESANLAKIIAGQEHYAALNTLITGSSEAAERSGQSFNQYADALERCTGTAEEMSAVMTDNLKGDFAELGSAVEALGIAAYDYIDGPIRSVVDGVTDGVNKVTDAIKREETELDVFTTLAKRHSDEVSANKKTSDYAYAEKMAEAEKVKYYMNIIKETQQSSDVSEYTKFQVGEAISYLSEYSEEISQYNGRVAEIFEISDDELMRIDSSLKKAQEKVKKTAVQSRRDALMMSKAEAELAIAEQKAILKKLEPMALEARADAGKALDDTGFFIGKHLGAAYYATQYDDDIRDADKIIAEQEAIIAKNEES